MSVSEGQDGTTRDISSKTPTDEEIMFAFNGIRHSDPALGRAKILAQLKETNKWTLSESRLKKVMSKHNATTKMDTPISYPKNAIAVQQAYKDNSTRCFKLYSRGPYDFGVTPNSDMALRIDVC